MAPQNCPTCQNPTHRILDTADLDARMDYYRCERCGTVWNIPKGATGPIQIVARPQSTDEFE